MNNAYTHPASMYLLFWMAGMALVISTYIWLYNIWKNPHQSHQSLKEHLLQDQITNLFAVCGLSIIIGAYDTIKFGTAYNITAEIMLLSAGSFGVMAFGKNKRIEKLTLHIFKTIKLGTFCTLGWTITLAIGYAIYQVISISDIFVQQDKIMIATMITGASWCAPIIILHKKLTCNKTTNLSTTNKNIKNKKLHNFLWPVLLAYFILLIPMITQEIANSREWRKMTNKKPIKTAYNTIMKTTHEKEIFDLYKLENN